MSKKYVYLFTEGNASMRELLGGKGANLAEMTNLGLPVPQASPFPPKPAPSITKTAAASTMRSRLKLWSTLKRWSRSPARSSAIRRTRFSFPSVPVHAHPCLA